MIRRTSRLLKPGGYLYIIGMEARNSVRADDVSESARILRAVKIGMTVKSDNDAVNKRVGGLQTGNPFKLVPLYSIPCESPRLMESYWHEKHKGKQERSEWYNLTEDEIKDIARTTMNFYETGEDEVFGDSADVLVRIERDMAAKTAKPERPVSVTAKGNKSSDDIETLYYTRQVVRDILGDSRLWLKKNPHASRTYLEEKEFMIVRNLLDRHPAASSKIGVGVKSIFVAETTYSGSYCFHVRRVDGTEEDFMLVTISVSLQTEKLARDVTLMKQVVTR